MWFRRYCSLTDYYCYYFFCLVVRGEVWSTFDMALANGVTRKHGPWLLIVSGIKWLWSCGFGSTAEVTKLLSCFFSPEGGYSSALGLVWWLRRGKKVRGIFNLGWLRVFSFVFYNQNWILVMSDQNGWINKFFCSSLIKTYVISVWTKSLFASRNKRLWTP